MLPIFSHSVEFLNSISKRAHPCLIFYFSGDASQVLILKLYLFKVLDGYIFLQENLQYSQYSFRELEVLLFTLGSITYLE